MAKWQTANLKHVKADQVLKVDISNAKAGYSFMFQP
jgi:hypothetical protein